jgi:uncharacterized membrane protein
LAVWFGSRNITLLFMHQSSNISERWFFRVSFFVFALIFASITFVNHYCFRTYAYDLGINNNAIYDYAHFRWNDCMLMQPQFTNVLSDHFSLIPLLVSPLRWLFGSYTMLFVQWVAVLFGGYGVYVFFKRISTKTYLPVLAMIYFFSIWGIYTALAYDYHDNVIAAMLVPWFINYFDKQSWKPAIAFYILILISKENMALWMVLLAPALGLMYWKDKKQVGRGFLLGGIALIYFSVIVGLVIPALANAERGYNHFRYAALGDNYGEALATIFTRPVYAIETLFKSTYPNNEFQGLKEGLFRLLFYSGVWALFVRPQYLIMLLPIFAQKLYSNDYGKWGIYAQYSIEFVPILAIAVFDALNRIKKPRITYALATVSIGMAIGANIDAFENKHLEWFDDDTIRFYSEGHYKQSFDIDEMHEALKIVPDDPAVIVSAQSFLVPHLCFRDYIYQYPYVSDADYVVLAIDPKNTYPIFGVDAMKDSLDAYRHKTDWEVLYDKNSTLIARRKTK